MQMSNCFSFLYDGKDIFSYDLTINESGNESEKTTEYRTADGLKFTHVLKQYPEYDAIEWVTFFENTSDTPSKTLSRIYDCDADIPFEHDENLPWCAYIPESDKDLKIYSPQGSLWDKKEFYCDEDALVNNRYLNHLYPGDSKTYKTSGGRSSQAVAPFFNLHRQGKGIVLAIGWTGQWSCTISRTNDSVNIKSGIENAQFYLLPGEKIRTSSTVLMQYEGSFVESQNKWRRLVKEHFSLIGKPGREKCGPLCAGVWGGMSTKGVIDRIETIKKEKLPFEYIWMDAGWYGTSTQPSPDEFEGDWGEFTGDWQVNKTHHPDELLDVRKAIKAAGMKFILWFEPERVKSNAPIYREHPEYFLTKGNDSNHLLNLGNDDAWQYCFDTLSNIIEKTQVNIYRQDFNFDPLDIWLAHDEMGRKGINEIKHITGLYKLWDKLLERFPSLCIDNCASGGRRIDIETLKRSIPLWRSDLQCPANFNIEDTQSHNMQFSTWIPFSGTGSGRDWSDSYRIRSCYAGAFTTNYTFSEKDSFGSKEQIQQIKKYLNEYLKIREYFYSDFYPLTDSIESEFSWNASQFNRPESCDGMVQIFRHSKSPFASAKFKLYGLDENKTYRIIDSDDDSHRDICGKELIESGLSIETDAPRSAKIFIYKAI